MLKLILILLLIAVLAVPGVLLWSKEPTDLASEPFVQKTIQPASEPTPTPTSELSISVPSRKILDNDYHIFQTFNNCGPAALSMTLSYFDIRISQQKLGIALRPYQNPQGDNDDKSVTLQELDQKARELGLASYHRPNGTVALLEKFIASGIPVITRTRLSDDEDIGHYRVVKGYDTVSNELIQDDSLQGHNLRYSYSQFERLWKVFNYEFLVIVPKDKASVAEQILGEDVDIKTAWTKAAENAKADIKADSNDIYARFNLAIALYYLGDFEGSVKEYEAVQANLPSRTLWYQIEPLLAYYKLGNYTEVLAITSKILSNHNRAYSELYILRGDIYKNQGKLDLAKAEYEKAVFYNVNMASAKEALKSVN